jgi:hypothetical protein
VLFVRRFCKPFSSPINAPPANSSWTFAERWFRDHCILYNSLPALYQPPMTGTVFKKDIYYLRFEVFTAVTMKNDVFWVVTPRGS